MGLETGTYIDSLVATNPVGATDPKSQGDDHLRLIKSTILATLPNLTGAMTRTHTELNNALILTVAGQIITAGSSPASGGLELASTRPMMIWDESDASVDEGRWYAHVNSGLFGIVAINDANSSSAQAIGISRTGIVLDKIQLKATVVTIVEEGAGTDEITIAHDGTSGTITTNTGHLILTPGNQVLRLLGDAADVTFELVVNSAIRAFINYVESGSTMNIDSDGTISLAPNNSEAVEIQTDGGILTPNTEADEFGYKGAPQVIDNTSRAIVLTDAGKQLYKASGGAGETFTIPANSSVAFPIGTIIVIINDGGGDLSIAITTDTLEAYGGATGTQTLTDNNKAVIEKVTATLWKYSATG